MGHDMKMQLSQDDSLFRFVHGLAFDSQKILFSDLAAEDLENLKKSSQSWPSSPELSWFLSGPGRKYLKDRCEVAESFKACGEHTRAKDNGHPGGVKYCKAHHILHGHTLLACEEHLVREKWLPITRVCETCFSWLCTVDGEVMAAKHGYRYILLAALHGLQC